MKEYIYFKYVFMRIVFRFTFITRFSPPARKLNTTTHALPPHHTPILMTSFIDVKSDTLDCFSQFFRNIIVRKHPLPSIATIDHTAMKFRKSIVPDITEASPEELSSNAYSSLKDFERQLCFLGKDVLDEDAFNALLDNIGYKRSREGLFESLLQEVTSATSSSWVNFMEDEKKDEVSKRFITVADIAKMYESEVYHLLDNGRDSGDTLMEYVRDCEYDAIFSWLILVLQTLL